MRKISYSLIALTVLCAGLVHGAEVKLAPPKPVEFKTNVQSQQLAPGSEERDQDLCYGTAKAMSEATNYLKDSITLPKTETSLEEDQDAVYAHYTSPSKESECLVLQNNGANDYAWGRGDNRVLGCTCSLVTAIK